MRSTSAVRNAEGDALASVSSLNRNVSIQSDRVARVLSRKRQLRLHRQTRHLRVRVAGGFQAGCTGDIERIRRRSSSPTGPHAGIRIRQHEMQSHRTAPLPTPLEEVGTGDAACSMRRLVRCPRRAELGRWSGATTGRRRTTSAGGPRAFLLEVAQLICAPSECIYVIPTDIYHL